MSTSGKFLQARLGTTPAGAPLEGNPPGLRIKGLMGWNADASVDELDATDSECGGFTNTDPGCKSLNCNLDIVVDTGGGFVGLVAGQYLTDLMLYENGYDTTCSWDMPYAVVTRAGRPAQIKGQVKQSVTVKNKGPFGGPDDSEVGSVAPYRRKRPAISPDA